MPDIYPDKEYYSISEVSEITELKAHVLRYWETQFKVLSPSKNRAGNRAYRKSDIQVVQLIKHLLYTEMYTIEGAQRKLQQLRQMRRKGVDALPEEERSRQALDDIRRRLVELRELIRE